MEEYKSTPGTWYRMALDDGYLLADPKVAKIIADKVVQHSQKVKSLLDQIAFYFIVNVQRYIRTNL